MADPRERHCTDRWQGQMNNLAMENSNTNAGDLLIGARRGMKTNRQRIRERMYERKGE